MPIYEYICQRHGPFDELIRADGYPCPECDQIARRHYRLNIAAESARHRGRWDPVVGEYVESERQFKSLLARGQQEQSEKLGMDVKLATCDSRDNEGLAELHGWSTDDRAADMEPVARAKRDAGG